MSHTSRISSLLAKSMAAAKPALENENPDTPADEITTTPGNAVGEGSLDTVVAENGDLDKPATVSIEDAELSADVAEAEAALDAGNGAVDQLDGARTVLTRSADLAESTLDDGGMSPQTAAAVGIAVDGVREQLGVDEEIVPATESFGGSSTRYQATVASLEAISDMAKRVGHAIMEAVRKVREFLGNLFNKLIEFLGSLERRNKSLAGKLKATQQLKSRSAHGRIDIGELYGRINVKGKVDLGELGKLPGLISAAANFDEAGMKALVEDYNFIRQAVSGAGGVTAAQIRVEMDAIPTGVFHKDGSGYATDVLPGNVRFKIVRDGNTDAVAGQDNVFSKLLSRFAATFKVVREDMDAGGGESTVDALTDQQVAQVIKVVDEVVAARKAAGNMKEAKGLDFKDMTISDSLSKEDQAGARAVMSKFASRIATANQASAKVIAYSARAAAAFQTYAFKSLAAYSKETKGGAVATTA